MRSKALAEVVLKQLRNFGMTGDALEPTRIGSALCDPRHRYDVIIAGEPILPAIDAMARYPKSSSGDPLPMVVLVGLHQEPSISRGKHGQWMATLPRAIKPRTLRAALVAARLPDGSNPPRLNPVAKVDAKAKSAPARSLRILIAEDNAVNQVLLQLLVESLGHRAQVVSSGAEALNALEIDSFDVVLMDVEMPGLDGIETSRAIRVRWETLQRRPHIVAVSAHTTADIRKRLADAGIDDFVPKPVIREALRDALDKVPR
jgi:CheY-like chemotaxis protein